MDDRNYTDLYATLQKETTILTAQIRALYRELDRKFHLRGAQIPITFGFETDTLGSYTRAGHHEKEHFHFSLLFVGYGVKNPLTKEDRMDLYRHDMPTTWNIISRSHVNIVAARTSRKRVEILLFSGRGRADTLLQGRGSPDET